MTKRPNKKSARVDDLERRGPEEKSDRVIVINADVVVMDGERRLEAMMKMAEKDKTKKRFYKIDAKTCRIVDVIGTGEIDIPKEAFTNATTEDLIKDQIPEVMHN